MAEVATRGAKVPMELDGVSTLAITAVVANGLLAGASLDQSIKQLPARHRIGTVAFSAYARAADLANGVPFYAALAGVAAATSISAGVSALIDGPDASRSSAAWVVLLLTAGWVLVTARAAPTYHSQERVGADETALEAILSRFARLQTVRVAFQVSAAAAAVWLLIETIIAS